MKNRFSGIPLLIISLLLVQCSSDPSRQSSEIFNIPEKKTVLLSNGETYSYIELGQPDIDSGKETLLLIHGNMASSVHFFPLFRYLDGVHLIALDLRGFGDSSYNEGFSSLAELAEDVKLFAETLGISRLHVAGWSLGGGVAMELALLYPDLVSSLFLIQGVSYKGLPFFKMTATGAYEPFSNREEMTQFPLIGTQLLAFQAQDADFFRRGWDLTIYTNKKPKASENSMYIAETLKQRNMLDVYWALACFNISAEHNGYVQGSGDIDYIKCPVTFTLADKDLMVSPSIVRENAASIPGSRLFEYKRCGHSPMVDMPARLATDILNHTGLGKLSR